MIRIRPRSVAVLLTGLAVVPTLVVAIISALGIYHASTAEIEADVRSRGALTARALAESARYAVVSGDAADLQDQLTALLDADRSLLDIDVVDSDGRSLARVFAGSAEGRTVELTEAIRVTPSRADLFESGGPRTDVATTLLPPAAVAGQVKVVLSTGPLEHERAQRLLFALLAIGGSAAFALAAALAVASRVRRPLRTIVQSLRDIERGHYHVDLGEQVPGEVGELQRRVQKMATAVQAARNDLESAVQARTTELNEALDRLTLAADERRRLIARNDAAIEAERKRVARDIHDSLGSSLVLLKLLAENMRERASSADGGERAALASLREQAGRIETAAATAYASSRAIAKAMRPEAIDTMGLARAIEDLVHEYDAAAPSCAFTVEVASDVPDLRAELAIIVFRVTQEALANTLKHAQATHAAVTLHVDGQQLYLQIKDDGIGFSPSTGLSDRGLGLVGMRERVQAVGGNLTITSTLAEGTTVAAILPLGIPAKVSGLMVADGSA
jgi:signal transduction histidine kinase